MLVQWPKSTEHLDIAFRVSISHAGKQIVDVLSKIQELSLSVRVKNNNNFPSRKAPLHAGTITCGAMLTGEE